MRLGGKVALVTGGTSGIGEATVARLCHEGAAVVFTGRNEAAGDRVAQATGGVFVRHDMVDRPGWQRVTDTIADRFGRLDIAFANAGLEGGDSDVEQISLEAWDEIVEVNLTGPMLTARHALGLMRSNPGGPCGSIILNSSMSGILALGNNVGYSTTKGALRLLSRSIAMHCAHNKLSVRCNSIHPGVVETALIRTALAAAPDPVAARAHLESLSPMRRMGTLEEIAGLVVYLASDEAAFITGAEYVIDGGSTAGMVAI